MIVVIAGVLGAWCVLLALFAVAWARAAAGMPRYEDGDLGSGGAGLPAGTAPTQGSDGWSVESSQGYTRVKDLTMTDCVPAKRSAPTPTRVRRRSHSSPTRRGSHRGASNQGPSRMPDNG